MLKLSLMKKVVATVDEEWRSPFAEKILDSRWDYDTGQVYYFRASANVLFVYGKGEKTYFLRLSDASVKKREWLEAEIEMLHYLRGKGLKVVIPVRSKNETYVETVETELGTFQAVVFEALPGKQFETEELPLENYFTWGSALGQLHHTFKGMPEKIRHNRTSWRDQLAFVEEKLPQHETAAKTELKKILEWATNKEVTSESFGLIHYDFELDNLRWENKEVAILDFDDCVNHWYVADIAYALRDLFKEKIDLENVLVKEFLQGYRSKTELDVRELQDLTWFMRMHHLVMFTKLLEAVDLDDSNQPEWLSQFNKKLIGYLENYRVSFIA
ncbi:phosphotransferase enzyme family protein [Pseudoneobacillus sp. C159]